MNAIGALILATTFKKVPLGVRRTYQYGQERCFIEWGLCAYDNDPSGELICGRSQEEECDCSRCDPELSPKPSNQEERSSI